MDDDPVVLEILSALLDECGIDSVPVSDGRAGMRMLLDQLFPVDLLVTDLVMPDLPGEALVMAIRDLAGERDLPILVASAFIDEDRASALKVVGADAVVDKGGGLAPVAAAARSLLAARGRLQAAEPIAATAELAPPEEPPQEVSVPLFRIGLTRRS